LPLSTRTRVIAKWYLEYLYESKKMHSILRLDNKGTETVVITMHALLRQHHGEVIGIYIAGE
jgi:hypothetical protein